MQDAAGALEPVTRRPRRAVRAAPGASRLGRLRRGAIVYPGLVRSAAASVLPILILAYMSGCKADDGATTSASAGSSGGATESASSTDGGSGSGDGTAGASTGAVTTVTTGDATTATTGGGTTGGTTGGMIACGAEVTCTGGQVCVIPCCGGPAPLCSDLNAMGACDSGDTPVPASECFGGCTGELCCPPVACTPDPPFCAGPDQLQCTGSSCSVDACTGMLEKGTLWCQCA